MNTTTAAAEAGVTVATIRTWCRTGVVTATKQAGRWVIDATSLAHRIEIGDRRKRVTSTYHVVEAETVIYKQTRTVYRVERADGTPAGFGPGCDGRLYNNEFFTRELADTYCRFYEETPSGYRLEKKQPTSRDLTRTGAYWVATGSTKGDPGQVDARWTDGQAVTDAYPAGTTWLDILIRRVNEHAAGAAERIAKKAERDAVAAAEEAVREAREEQLAEARREKGVLATERQVDYIISLLAARERSGDGGGFYIGPKNHADIELMSKGEASLYITSLKGDY